MNRRTALLTAGVGVLLALLAPGAAQAAPDTGTGLAATLNADDMNAPSLTLTNRTGAPCQVATRALGTVSVTSVVQNGRPVRVVAVDPSFPDSLDTIIAGQLTTLAPGASTTIALPLVPFESGVALESVSWSADASLGALFPVLKGVPATVSATYAVPPLANLAGAPLCPPATAGRVESAATSHATAHGGAPVWIYVAVAVGLVVVALAVLIAVWLVRRDRRRATGGLAVLLLVAAVGAVQLSTARPAAATVNVAPGLAKNWADCAPVFGMAGGDPAGIFGSLNDPKNNVQIIDANGDQTHEIKVGNTIIIFWNVNDRHKYSGDSGNADPCTSLYHEAYHGWEDLNGGQDHSPCVTADGDSGLPVNEVKATKAQNVLRAKLGLKTRKTYGDTPLPPGDCLPKDKQPKPKTNCVGAGCGDTNGDPHLRTFDGERYDFQAVGEFVGARDGDFQVQFRQQPAGTSKTVSLTTGVAMAVAGDRVEVDLAVEGVTLTVNGAHQPLATTSLPHGGTVTLDDTDFPPQVVVAWPDGSTAWISVIARYALHVTVKPAAAHADKLVGLLGDFGGTQDPDLRTAGGKVLPKPPAYGDLYPAFADSWRVTAATSLFTYPPGASTATYTDRSLPVAPVDERSLPAAAAAETYCRRVGVLEALSLRNCVLDVAETGLAGMARAALASQAIDASVAGPGPTTSASLGTTRQATLTVTQPNGSARLTFVGIPGQRVFASFTSPTLRAGCGVLSLVEPDGTTDDIGCLDATGAGTLGGDPITKAATYAYVFTPRDGAVGQLNLTLTFSTDSLGPLPADGSPVTATIAAPGQVAAFTFDGTLGQRALVVIKGSTLPAQCGVPSLVGPNGTTLAIGCLAADGGGLLDGTVLPTTGKYTVRVDPAEAGTGQLTLSLQVGEDQHGTVVVGGPAVTASITRPGQVARFTFTASKGQKLTVYVTASTIPHQCGVPVLRDPVGTAFTEGCVDVDGTGTLTATAVAGGTYTIDIDPAELGTGTVTFRIA